MTWRLRWLVGIDRILAVVMTLLLVGTPLAFGGAVWWARPTLAVMIVLLVVATLARIALEGTWRVLKSPMLPLGGLVLVLALIQLMPLPSVVARLVSPQSRGVYAHGVLPSRALSDDPELHLDGAGPSRSPVSVDRPATLRWLFGATACLALFWVAAQFADRLGHLGVIWGSVVVAFFGNTTISLVQLLGGARGLFGFIEPGEGPAWGPSLADVAAAPATSALRLVAAPGEIDSPWAVLALDRPPLLGSLLGGPGAYLALGALAMPLALGLVLQLMAPRGSREPLWSRLRLSGRASLAVILIGLTLLSATLVGLMAGPVWCLPFVVGVLVVGLPSAGPTGLRWTAVTLTGAVVLAIGAGVLLGQVIDPALWPDGRALTATSWETSRRVWADAARVARDFPLLGAGLGSFAAIVPYYKTHDETTTTALSSLLQWWAEAGVVGLLLLGLAGVWVVVRLPGALRRVGTADRALAFGLLGTAVCFTLFATLHWTIELAAVAVAASAVAGTFERWLAGGTDLFVERA